MKALARLVCVFLLVCSALAPVAPALAQEPQPPVAMAVEGGDPTQDTALALQPQTPGGPHRGLFLRASLGVGRFVAYNKSLDARGDRRSFSGTTGSLQAVIGGTLKNKLVMGGAYGRDQVFGLTLPGS